MSVGSSSNTGTYAAPQVSHEAASSSGPKSSLATLAEKLEAAPPKVNRIETIKVDGLVLLKIIKHCTESLPELCTGSLLGMDVESTLEVTNSFPFPESGSADNENDDDAEKESFGTKYQFEMLKLLRDVNVDCNPVGWYRSTYMGSFCTSELVEYLYQYQDQFDKASCQKSAVLIYDPFQTKKGNLALKAYRLSDAFMKMFRERKEGVKGKPGNVVKLSANVVSAVGGLKGDGSATISSVVSELSAEEIFEEIPIEITNSNLFTVLIEDFKERNGGKLDVDFDRLNLSTNPYLEKNFEFLIEEVDNLVNEQQKMQAEQRRTAKIEQEQIKWIQQRRLENKAREERGEPLLPEDADPSNPIFKPSTQSSRLESLLIRKQINIYCDQINKFTGSGFSKMYLASAIQGDE